MKDRCEYCEYRNGWECGDGAFYARCSCGFHYGCDKPKYKNSTIPKIPAPKKLFNYCPSCGARKTRYYDEPIYIDKYWYDKYWFE